MATHQSLTRILEDKFKGLLEAAPNAMVIVDAVGRLLLVNAHTEKLFRCMPGEILGQSVEKLVPERFRGQHPAHRQHFFAAPRVRPMGMGRDR